jgi:hypothetical protein
MNPRTSIARPSGGLPARPATAALEVQGPELGPSPFGHRSLAEELVGIAQERRARGIRTPRPGLGTRAATDPRVVTSPRAFVSPRVLTSPRTFADPRGTTTIRAALRRD